MASLRPRYHLRAASEYSALICLYSWARSRSAREVTLTRYAMLGFKFVKELPRGPCSSFFYVLQTLSDALLCVGTGGNVEQALIGLGILHDGCCLPLHRKHHWALALLELFHKVAGTSAE